MSFEKSNFSTKQVQWTRSEIFSEKRFNTIFIPLLFAFKCPRDSSFIVFVKSQNTLHNFSLSLILFVFLSLSLSLTHTYFSCIYLSLSLSLSLCYTCTRIIFVSTGILFLPLFSNTYTFYICIRLLFASLCLISIFLFLFIVHTRSKSTLVSLILSTWKTKKVFILW